MKLKKDPHDIARLQAALRGLRGDWEEDGSIPCNYRICDGMGTMIAEVSRWCGGFQNPHYPATIGWRVQLGNQSDHDVVVVGGEDGKGYCPTCGGTTDDDPIEIAIATAKRMAEKGLKRLLRTE